MSPVPYSPIFIRAVSFLVGDLTASRQDTTHSTGANLILAGHIHAIWLHESHSRTRRNWKARHPCVKLQDAPRHEKASSKIWSWMRRQYRVQAHRIRSYVHYYAPVRLHTVTLQATCMATNNPPLHAIGCLPPSHSRALHCSILSIHSSMLVIETLLKHMQLLSCYP